MGQFCDFIYAPKTRVFAWKWAEKSVCLGGSGAKRRWIGVNWWEKTSEFSILTSISLMWNRVLGFPNTDSLVYECVHSGRQIRFEETKREPQTWVDYSWLMLEWVFGLFCLWSLEYLDWELRGCSWRTCQLNGRDRDCTIPDSAGATRLKSEQKMIDRRSDSTLAIDRLAPQIVPVPP